MVKIQNHPGQRISKPLPSPMPTHWYIQAGDGDFTFNSLVEMLPGREAERVELPDGNVIPLWSVTYAQVEVLEASRQTERRLKFSVFYKDKTTGDVKLWRDKDSYIHRNPSLLLPMRSARYRRHQRKGLPRGSGPSAEITVLLEIPNMMRGMDVPIPGQPKVDQPKSGRPPARTAI